MSEQAVDLRSTLAVLRRHRAALAGAALVGAIAGAGLVTVRPPLYVSTTQVLLPQPQSNDGQPTSRDPQTDAQVAASEAVLGRAAHAMKPRLTTRQMQRAITVSAPSDNVLQFSAEAATPSLATRIAQQAAHAETRYVEQASSSVSAAQLAELKKRQESLKASLATVNAEIKKTTVRQAGETSSSTAGRADAAALSQLTAQQANLVLQIDQVSAQMDGNRGSASSAASIIENAVPGKRAGVAKRYLVGVGTGLVAGMLLMAVLLVAFGRRDRRLRFRDEIADALGNTVTASIRSRRATTVAAWTSLMEGYQPSTVDAWALRQVLRQLVFESSTGHHGVGHDLDRSGTITVISMSGDAAALATGPQLASYAASVGIRTRLVASQRHEAAAPLWAACHRGPGQEELRPGLYVEPGTDSPREVQLTVIMTVVDRAKPLLSAPERDAATVLAVSSGSATAEELARVAVTADDADATIAGLVVVDPDDLDRTTGRLLQNARAQEVALPTRLTGMPTVTSGPGAHLGRGSK